MIYGPSYALIACLLAICWLSPPARGQYPGCDYTQNMALGSTLRIYSPGYPVNYKGLVNCRWTAIAPIGSIIRAQCDVAIPTSAQCTQDRILVSTTGQANLTDANSFCGSGTFSRVSNNNRLVLALLAPAGSRGGKLTCQLSVTTPPCQCGVRNSQTSMNTTTRIVGGVEAGVNEFPMMAGLVNLRSRDILCGATIISNRHALTAAHCLISETISTIALLVGDHDLTTGVDTPYAALYPLNRLLSHKGFNVATSANDIALVFTASTIAFNYGVLPACLPITLTTNTFAGQSVLATGWGTTEFGGPMASRLRQVSLNVITNAVCRKSYPRLQNMNICTYSSGRDTCQRDSGGPLLWPNPRAGLLYLVGISSYGLYCGGSEPGVSTRVASYLPWIVQNTPGTTYCRPTA